jgi:anti-anti-sigma factor
VTGVRITTPRELDVGTSDALLRRVRELEPDAGPVEIDLRGVTFIDSFGLRALMEADRRIAERAARPRLLVAPRGPVERLLQLTLLDRTLDVRVEPPA